MKTLLLLLLTITTYSQEVILSAGSDEYSIGQIFYISPEGIQQITIKPTVWVTSWSEGVPDYSLDAIIDGNYSTSVNGTIIANSLTVNYDKSLIINSGTNVTIQNEVINNGTLIVENNANLIQVNDVLNTGEITVNRNSNELKRLDYTAWSSPVSGPQTLINFSPLTSLNRFYEFNTTAGTNGLYQAIIPSTQNFIIGKGYLIRMPNALPLIGYNDGLTTMTYNGIFNGIPNNGDIQVTLFSNGGQNSYNLVGNPYPSVINVQDFLSVNRGLIGGTLYFWRKVNAAGGTAYATRTNLGGTATPSSETPNEFIQIGQGFIVQSLNTGTTVIPNFFTNLMRVPNPNSTQFFKTKQVTQKDRIWLNLTSKTGVFSQTLIGYISDATLGVDSYDGKYINDNPIALTSSINNEEYTIQGRPSFDATDVVQLNFKTDIAGDYTIAIDHSDGVFASGHDVYLVDTKTGIETNLTIENYNFIADTGVDNTRFLLKYQKTLEVDKPEFNKNSISVYIKNGNLYVNSTEIDINNIQVYDIKGRLIVERKNVKSNKTILYNLKTMYQVLLVKISGVNNEELTKKIYINSL
jgi:hypothetical protein